MVGYGMCGHQIQGMSLCLKRIKSAEEGSDLRGLLEKTAYHLHLKRPDATRDEN